MQEDNKDLLEQELTKRNEEVVSDNSAYLAAIKELKENSVSKDAYEALAAREKKLLEATINGWAPEKQEQEIGPRMEYYKKYKENKFATDLEYWENFINLRKATIKEYGADPCVTGNYGLTPDGGRVDPAYGEQETIDDQINRIEEFIKEANGNSLVFETLMHSAMPRK